MAPFLRDDYTLKKQCTVPVALTYGGNFVWRIDNDPISVQYEFQTDFSTNSREIKYRNMDIGLLHVNVAHVKNDVK